jgi:hypothetical protein
MIKLLTVFKKRPVVETAPAISSASTPEFKSEVDDAEWERLRAPRFGHENVLSGWTRKWLEALPQTLHPAVLSAQYAHVANRLALGWRDPFLTEDLFNELLIDRRNGRKGFPPEVIAELQRLRDFHSRGRGFTTTPDDVDTEPLELSDQ